MAKAKTSIFDMMEDTPKVNAEVAATAEQQKLMEQAGELQAVHFIGPNGKYIPGFYSTTERAFLPQFKID